MVDDLPGNVGTGTVIGKFVTAQKGTGSSPISVPVVGTVTFTPSPASVKDAGADPPETILPLPTVVTLDASGSLSVDLVATDDTDLNPSGWTYKVSFKFTGVSLTSFSISVPEGQTVDLTDVAPVSSSNGVQITRGIGVPDTADASTGDVVTWNGTATEWAAPTSSDDVALSDLADVDLTTAATDGQALVYDADASKWKAGTVSGSDAVESVNAQTGAVVLDADDIDDSATTNKFVSAADLTKLSNLSGTNTGDQTTITGNAGTATKLATARNINGVAFDGSANITVADSTKVPTTTTVNGHALSANVVVSADDLTTGTVDYERLPAGLEIVAYDDSGTWPDRPTSRTDLVVIWRTYNGTAEPSAATSPAVNGAYAGVDVYDNVATS